MQTLQNPERMVRLAIVPGILALALLLTDLFHPVNRPAVPYIFLAAVAASSWVAGRVAGLVAVALTSLAFDYLFLPPIYSLRLSSESLASALPYLLSALATAWMSSVRHQAEEARGSNNRLRTAMEQAAQEILITALNGRITYVNRAFTAITGYTFSEIFGQNPRIFNSGRQRPSFYTDMWATILSGQVGMARSPTVAKTAA